MNILISISLIANISFGLLALFSAIAIIIYRKNFPLHNGIVILFFSVGAISILSSLTSTYDNILFIKLYFVSKCVLPIFLLIFSEYILKIYYTIRIKLLVLISTVVFGILAFLQSDTNNLFEIVLNYFWVGLALLIFTHIMRTLFRNPGLLARRNLIIAILLCFAMLLNIVVKQIDGSSIAAFSDGLYALLVTHLIVLIIASAGINQLRALLKKVLIIIALSLMLPLSLKLFYPEIRQDYLITLCIFSSTVFSLIYVIGEIIKNPKEIRSSKLISRLLNIPLQDRSRFLSTLGEWDEVEKLHIVQHEQIEGEVDKLDLFFERVGYVVHKYQIQELNKVLGNNSDYKTGIEVAEFYFKKFQCNSLFQLSHKGDLMTLKYIDGLNPALFANEISLMSKIVSSISSKEKEQ